MALERRTTFYSGTVQGVGFRWTAMRALSGLAVTGFVRNLRDGRVELVLEGSPEEIDRASLRVRDALGAYIHAEEARTGPSTGEFTEFGIRR